VLPGLLVGVSLQNLFVNFVTFSAISSYNGALSSGPEDPEYDSLAQLKLVDNFNPSGKVGIIYSPHRMVRLGVSYQLPFWIRGGGKINVQLPTSSLYEKSRVEGDSADVAITLPMMLRAGVEVRPLEGLRVELEVDWEQWSATQSIQVFPKDIFILNIPSIDRYRVPTLQTPLNFQDSVTVRLGAEHTFQRIPLTLRGGYLFERGATQQAYASVGSMDSDKHVITLGVGYAVAGYRFDLMVARSFSATRVVDFRESKSLQVNPINPTGAVGVGGGTYHSDYTVFGIGAHKSFF